MITKQVFVVVFSVFVLLGAGCQSTEAPVVSNAVQSEIPTTSVVPVVPTSTVLVNPVVVVEPATNKTVVIKNFVFKPAMLSVKKGATVTWINQDSAPHTVAIGEDVFPSDGLSNGQSFSLTFDKVGTFNYFCSYHPSMTAVIVVTE